MNWAFAHEAGRARRKRGSWARFDCIGGCVGDVVFCSTASADVLWDQVPNQRGGYVSDTDQTFFGQEHYWQRMADDFQLGADAALTQASVYAFFYNSYSAPDDEVVRLRLYHARLSDGLPDENAILYEQTVQNPSRQETGEHVLAGSDGPEYRYTIDLETPFTAAAETKYWLEFIQLGDPDSDFVWESSHVLSALDNAAGNNAVHPNWAYTAPGNGFAFQLLTPEPGTVGLVLFGLVFSRRRCVRRGACARSGEHFAKKTNVPRVRSLIVATIMSLLVAPAASADVVWNQVPYQGGGFVSDTDQTFFGQEHYWQRMADDFQLGADASLTQATVYGFFYNSYSAPMNEVVRLRLYHARLSDGLPDENAIVYEQTIQNPSRQETGEHVFAGSDGPEYRYTIDLVPPVEIAADTRYWLEFIQVDDPESDFFWETALTTSPQDRVAGTNAIHPNWDYAAPRAALAFQLLTPEPGTIGFLAFGLLFTQRRRLRRGSSARSG